MLLGSWWACYSFKLHVMYFLRNATQIHICCINWGYWQWSAMNQIEKYFRFMNDTCSLYTWKLSGSFLFRCKLASRPHTIFRKCMPIMLPLVESEIVFSNLQRIQVLIEFSHCLFFKNTQHKKVFGVNYYRLWTFVELNSHVIVKPSTHLEMFKSSFPKVCCCNRVTPYRNFGKVLSLVLCCHWSNPSVFLGNLNTSIFESFL